MKNFLKCSIILSLAILPLKTNTASAHYYGANFPKTAIAHINKHGRENCRALGNRGYKAKIRGRIDNQDYSDGPFYSEYYPFTVISCFKTLKQCRHFISRIRNRVGSIERIRRARCTAN